ncbi:hypothetical protein I4F81_010758 [Pyropia yezoensis]|uniref:Uncharacterized protein n=1 Tax=Pyropia yezoensis TaxID=2788 RepID=A0ACC3CE92_PYRYE|nr:hypothetical protein I4F81_010758 [Neopyropia yezoensis]
MRSTHPSGVRRAATERRKEGEHKPIVERSHVEGGGKAGEGGRGCRPLPPAGIAAATPTTAATAATSAAAAAVTTIAAAATAAATTAVTIIGGGDRSGGGGEGASSGGSTTDIAGARRGRSGAPCWRPSTVTAPAVAVTATAAATTAASAAAVAAVTAAADGAAAAAERHGLRRWARIAEADAGRRPRCAARCIPIAEDYVEEGRGTVQRGPVTLQVVLVSHTSFLFTSPITR